MADTCLDCFEPARTESLDNPFKKHVNDCCAEAAEVQHSRCGPAFIIDPHPGLITSVPPVSKLDTPSKPVLGQQFKTLPVLRA